MRVIDQNTAVPVRPAEGQTAVHINAHIAEVVTYKGDYDVLPRGDQDTVLRTQGMQMSKDVTVVKVPRYVVSNPVGGETVYIGGEYNGQI